MGSAMVSTISKLLREVRLGDPVSESGLTLIPMFAKFADAPPLMTLGEGIECEALVVTEVDAGGEVPELRAANRGKLGILILDGEEFAGAKQNRVLNTTVYLSPGCEITIPVSCTEHGRWHYVSERFADSGYVAARSVRVAAHRSVTKNVRAKMGYRSNQSEVWDRVAMLHRANEVSSETGAMRDVYEKHKDRMGRRELAFPVQDGQSGVFALWGGRVVGFDVLATPAVYSPLHERLVRSYAIDALAESAKTGKNDLRIAKEFLVSLADSQPTVHESPGDGVSNRFTGPGFTGSMLTLDDAILHGVFFATSE